MASFPVTSCCPRCLFPVPVPHHSCSLYLFHMHTCVGSPEPLLVPVTMSATITWTGTIISLRKHAYSNILKISPPKTENLQIKNSNIFHISAENTDCGYSLEPPWWGGSNEYPYSMFLSRNKKNNVFPCKPQFYCIKVGFKGVKII